MRTPRPIVIDEVAKRLTELPDGSWLEDIFTRLEALEESVFGTSGFNILLEDGSILLLEDGGYGLLETDATFIVLTEDGNRLVQEEGSVLELENA
jgi:hypothetical protein